MQLSRLPSIQVDTCPTRVCKPKLSFFYWVRLRSGSRLARTSRSKDLASKLGWSVSFPPCILPSRHVEPRHSRERERGRDDVVEKSPHIVRFSHYDGHDTILVATNALFMIPRVHSIALRRGAALGGISQPPTLNTYSRQSFSAK